MHEFILLAVVISVWLLLDWRWFVALMAIGALVANFNAFIAWARTKITTKALTAAAIITSGFVVAIALVAITLITIAAVASLTIAFVTLVALIALIAFIPVLAVYVGGFYLRDGHSDVTKSFTGLACCTIAFLFWLSGSGILFTALYNEKKGLQSFIKSLIAVGCYIAAVGTVYFYAKMLA